MQDEITRLTSSPVPRRPDRDHPTGQNTQTPIRRHPGLLRPPHTSNAPHEALNGRFAHLRGTAPGLPKPHPLHHQALLETSRFKPPPYPKIMKRRIRLDAPAGGKTHFSLKLQRKNQVRFCFCHVSARRRRATLRFQPGHVIDAERDTSHVARLPGLLLSCTFSGANRTVTTTRHRLTTGRKPLF